MKAILLFAGYFCSFIYTPAVSEVMKKVFRYLYTGYFSRFFRSFGKSSLISPYFRCVRGLNYIVVGERSYIGANVELTAWDTYHSQHFSPEIVIGNNVSIRDCSHITAIQSIRIGNGVLTGPNILITDNAHGDSVAKLLDISPVLRPLVSKGPVVIEDNVWIGEKSSIMPGVHIGKGCIIAANSVVTKDIPPYCVAAGIPARVVKEMKPIL